MTTLNLKPSHKPVKAYYDALRQFELINVSHETAVKVAFQNLLEHCARQFGWMLVLEWDVKRPKLRPVRVDGAIVDSFKLTHGFWEAKDEQDDLGKEVKKKFAIDYPRDNIIFQAPERAILWQNGRQVTDEDITKPERLIEILKLFFGYQPPAFEEWDTAVSEFRDRVPELAHALVDVIEKERKSNSNFIEAFNGFAELCRQSINPNISEAAVEEMLIQHLLTERIFRRIFNNPDFTRRNVIAAEIEEVINALTSHSFSRDAFLKNFDRFYRAIETTAATIEDFSQKQHFLNAVYEKFFQGFSVKVADTHGIVYTPQPIVSFMVRSVEDILKKEFGKSFGDRDVHILDPFVGTGNFIVRCMQEMKKTALGYKYKNELHCNEVMLLPYYIASMNIEHEYLELTGAYEPFDGICLVDTFELAEESQRAFAFMTAENTARVERQKKSPIFVIIGNPPYNVGQLNENDNNKNRKYKEIERRVSATYARESGATNKNALSDPYVKAFRWASDRISSHGIVALVTNDSFIDQLAFDGMRKNLERDFDLIYLLDLGGNVRKNPKLSGSTHNVFGIQVGVSIGVFVRTRERAGGRAKIFYASVGRSWRREDKYRYLEEVVYGPGVEWKELHPDQRHTWLTEDLSGDFEEMIPIGTKEGKAGTAESVRCMFKVYGGGVKTSRDSWAYNFDQTSLVENMMLTIEAYNFQVAQWSLLGSRTPPVDEFVRYDDRRISWSRGLKSYLTRGKIAEIRVGSVRHAMYRPFTNLHMFFDRIMNEMVYKFPSIFPSANAELENLVMCATGVGAERPFATMVTRAISDLNFFGPGTVPQWFPFYTYNEDGTNRRENISDWALGQFRVHYKDQAITKWDIFYYIYALLHHPEYRQKYAANLKRELPRIPFAPNFQGFADAGKRLAEIHVNYEQQSEYPLERIENPQEKLNWQVEKMKLTKDKTAVIYNDFLTLSGIPPEVFEYRLGNRSALDWVIDQYQVSTDKRSGIVNDPNRADDPEYITRLIGQVITVSLETVKIVKSLPPLS
jgi:predicted helicase